MNLLFKNSQQLKVANCFQKKDHHRCLTGSEIPVWLGSNRANTNTVQIMNYNFLFIINITPRPGIGAHRKFGVDKMKLICFVTRVLLLRKT